MHRSSTRCSRGPGSKSCQVHEASTAVLVAVLRGVLLPKPPVIEPWLDDAKLPGVNDGHGIAVDWCVYHWVSLSEREQCPVASLFSLELWMSKACRHVHCSHSERSTVWDLRCLRDDARILGGNGWLRVCDRLKCIPLVLGSTSRSERKEPCLTTRAFLVFQATRCSLGPHSEGTEWYASASLCLPSHFV